MCALRRPPHRRLELTLRDPRIGVTVRLYYTVFADSDVIARCAAVRYDGGETLVLHQAASAHLELPDGGLRPSGCPAHSAGSGR